MRQQSLFTQLPRDWNCSPIKALGRFYGGGTPSKENAEYWSGQIPWVSPKDMKVNRVSDAEDHISPAAVRESATRLVPVGSLVLVVRSGILQHTIPVATTACEVALNQDMKAFVPHLGTSARFVMYVIAGYQDVLLQRWRKLGATVESLDFAAVQGELVPVPPPPRQRAIADFLDTKTVAIDALIAKKERLIELLQEKRQALITQAVTKGLDPNVPMKDSGIEWLGEIPAHWEVRRTKHLARLVRGKFGHRPRNDPALYGGTFPFIQTGDIARAPKFVDEYVQTLNDRGRGVSQMFPSGTLAMAIAANVGDVAIVRFDAWFPDSVIGCVPQPGRTDVEYLYYLFIAMEPELDAAATSNTQQNLNIERVGGIPSPIPPLAEQRSIAKCLAAADERIARIRDTVRVQLERLLEYRQALITAAVTGQLDVSASDATDGTIAGEATA